MFDGITFDEAQDGDRLRSQINRVKNLMKDGKWRGLAEIAEAVGGSEAGVSARLRDLRKYKFGRYLVVSKRIKKGYWEYRLIIKEDK